MQAKEIFSSRRIQLALIQKHRNTSGESTVDKLFLDDTIHQIDLARYYCGEVTPVATTYTMEGGEVAGVVSQMEIPGGGQCLLAVARKVGAWQECVTLDGDGMTVHVNAFGLIVKYQILDHLWHGYSQASLVCACAGLSRWSTSSNASKHANFPAPTRWKQPDTGTNGKAAGE